jgi:hypothetical protein
MSVILESSLSLRRIIREHDVVMDRAAGLKAFRRFLQADDRSAPRVGSSESVRLNANCAYSASLSESGMARFGWTIFLKSLDGAAPIHVGCSPWRSSLDPELVSKRLEYTVS